MKRSVTCTQSSMEFVGQCPVHGFHRPVGRSSLPVECPTHDGYVCIPPHQKRVGTVPPPADSDIEALAAIDSGVGASDIYVVTAKWDNEGEMVIGAFLLPDPAKACAEGYAGGDEQFVQVFNGKDGRMLKLIRRYSSGFAPTLTWSDWTETVTCHVS